MKSNIKNQNFFIIFFTVILFFIPRINLISIGNQTAGIRIDDLVLLIIFLILVFKNLITTLNTKIFENKFLKINTEKIYIIYFLFVMSLFLSFYLNTFFGETQLGKQSILYPLRYIEYFVFFIIGTLIVNEKRFLRIIFLLLTFQISILFLQNMGFMPAFTSTDGIVFGVNAGTTGGPWELSIIFSLCFAVYVNHFARVKFIIFTFLFIIALFYSYIYLLESRSATSTFLVLTIFLFFSIFSDLTYKNYFKKFIIIFLLISSLLSIYLFKPSNYLLENQYLNNECMINQDEVCQSNIFTRSTDLFRSDNITILFEYYKIVKKYPKEAKITIPSVIGSSGEYGYRFDRSWWQRVEKWVYGAVIWQDRLPYSFLLGIGPGTVGPSFDGNWLRIIIENGIVSLLLIIFFLFQAIKVNSKNFLPILAMSINMIFIDAFLAYKSTSLFLFILGYYYSSGVLKSNMNE